MFRDGPINTVAYAASATRVLFVLKEVNVKDEGDEWDLREYLREGGRGQTWNNVVRWTRAILDGDMRNEGAGILDEGDRSTTLARIAVMNLNKDGGRSCTDPKRLNEATERARDLLREQVRVLDPHLVVCCGDHTGNAAGKYIFDYGRDDWRSVPASVPVWVGTPVNGRMIVSMPHPQARRSAGELYEAMQAGVQAARASLASRLEPR